MLWSARDFSRRCLSHEVNKHNSWFQTFAAVWMRPSLFWDVTQLGWCLVTDISGQPVGPIFEGQAVKEDVWTAWSSSWTAWLLNMVPIGCPETSLTTNVRWAASQKTKILKHIIEIISHHMSLDLHVSYVMKVNRFRLNLVFESWTKYSNNSNNNNNNVIAISWRGM